MIEAAPSRSELPTQSAPVSPPPITITCLPAAVIARGGGAATLGAGPNSPATQRLRTYRYSMAKWIPSSARPGTGRSRGTREPMARTTASKPARSSSVETSPPDVDPAAELDPLVEELADPPLDDRLLDLEVGDPEADEPPGGLVALEEDDAVSGAA